MNTLNAVTVAKHFEEHNAVVGNSFEVLKDTILLAAEEAVKCLSAGGTIFWCGNGGSAADCQHLAAELVGRFKNNRRPLKSISLTTDSSVLTCIANDYSYSDIFSRQIEGLGQKNDLLFAVSTSGNSENIQLALSAAKKIGMISIALLGKGGGASVEMADIILVVPSDSTARIQETHILIGHILCDLIEKGMGLSG
jgi:D-sedoheptulose 7-phosphate isomerase